jgi:hypothetical protein
MKRDHKRMSIPAFGFIMIRHVSSKTTDLYWKESYASIRRFYPNVPILIIDDSSQRKYLREDIHTTNCTVIYDVEHKGRAELLPYYYFHRLKPFQRAVIIHDAVFLQAPLDFSHFDTNKSEGNIQFLWSIPHYHDDSIMGQINELIDALPSECRDDVRSMYVHTKADWIGVFGVMSIVDWTWLNGVNERYRLFDNWFPVLKDREYRCALERVFGLVAYHHLRDLVKNPLFGSIQHYVKWGVTFAEYLADYESYQVYPLIKVWSGR